ncbi:MAG: hypothetical protein KF764_00795 [Labilithrix sp.]|nr:hypothetical protein [Labilithrix sp.]
MPASTFLYVSRVAADRDVLMAYDRDSGQARTVTDLRGDGSNGWTIDGYSLSKDRTRIAAATLYGPTQADVATKLSAQRIWSFATDGSDFRRLTPVFENTSQGRAQFQIEVRNPSFSRDGATVFVGYGEYWYEGTSLNGASGIWTVGAAGDQVPNLFKAPNPCSLVSPSVDPSTGKVAVLHSVCIPGQGQDGIHLYAEDGSGTPELLVRSDATLNVMLEPPRWLPDGSGFLFIAVSNNVRGLFAFDMASRKASPIVVPEAADSRVTDGTIAPDGGSIVYCLREGEASNLHLIDLTKDPATDAAITTDGKSCHPVW